MLFLGFGCARTNAWALSVYTSGFSRDTSANTKLRISVAKTRNWDLVRANFKKTFARITFKVVLSTFGKGYGSGDE